MKWPPKSKKSMLLLLPVVLIAAGVVTYVFWWGKSPSTDSDSSNQIKDVQVDNIFSALTQNQSRSSFSSFISGVDFSAKLVANKAGAVPKLMLFAPSNVAFEKDDLKPLSNLEATLKLDIQLYHGAILYPSADGSGPDMDLSDGQVINTLAGRQLFVRKVGTHFVLTDVKGRDSTVDLTYMTDKDGHRLYFVNSVLLLQ